MSVFSPPYKRVLLKISGEALKGNHAYGFDKEAVGVIVEQIASACATGMQIALVVGGGNIFRGTSHEAQGIDRVSADSMGMLATVINALLLQSHFEKRGLTTRVMTAIPMQTMGEPYVRRRAIRHLERGRLVIFAAGTGNPFFSTDSAAALRASEMNCDVLFKATKVDGIYDKDPVINSDAKRYSKIDYDDVLQSHLQVMDATAVALARENNIILVVFSLLAKESFSQVLQGKGVYTVVANLKGRTLINGR